MEQDQVRRWEAQCIQEQAPACTTACPMHVDVRKLIDYLRKGDFKNGFAVLARSVPLPSIVAYLCDHPCQKSCRRSEAGDAICIQALERACAEYGGPPTVVSAQTHKEQKVAIVGGDISGVSAAILLATKGYQVEIFETGAALLASVRRFDARTLPSHAIEADLEKLTQLAITVNCNCSSLLENKDFTLESFAQDFDAVYVEAEADLISQVPYSDDLLADSLTLATAHPKIFANTIPAENSLIFSVYQGSVAAISIDRLLQGASLTANRENQGPYPSRLFVNTREEISLPAVVPADSVGSYSREEAQQEANRCFPCQCLECVKVCEYLKEYGSYPKRYVREIYNNECIIKGLHTANRMINSCTLCGLCATVCPEKLSMAEICLQARQGMVQTGKMPPSAHEFALRDMAFSTSDAFTLVRHQPGFEISRLAFLPGCQLSASSPSHVASCYQHLCETNSGGVGLILSCCGAPALWAGEELLFHQTLHALKNAWKQLGEPRLITACSSCYRVLHDHLPEVPVETLWSHLDLDRISPFHQLNSRSMAIHDPCSTREMPEVEDSARELLQQLGIEVQELNERGLSTCCGYGGLTQFANPDLADKIVKRRAEESQQDFVTYCAMCRDRFAHNGKRAVHILDLIFPLNQEADPAARPDPGFSSRQENRARLKSQLLQKLWGEMGSFVEASVQLNISEEVRILLEKRMILIEDVRKVVAHAEETGEKFEDPATGHLLASYRPTCVTYWVEYTVEGSCYVIHNAYSHRMQVS